MRTISTFVEMVHHTFRCLYIYNIEHVAQFKLFYSVIYRE